MFKFRKYAENLISMNGENFLIVPDKQQVGQN